MTTLLLTVALTFAVMLTVIAAMSIGVIHGRRPIQGSCGGVGGKGCELCTNGRCRKAKRAIRDGGDE